MKTTVIWFSVTLATAIGLVVAGIIIPPPGIIDPSVLTAVGELLGFGALAQVPMLIKRGTDFTINHGNTSVQINTPDNEDKSGTQEP